MIGTPAREGTTSPCTTPKSASDARTSASIERSTPKSASISGDHVRAVRSINNVREALDASVRNSPPSTPPVKTHSSQESTVAKAGTRAPSARPRSSIQCIFVAEKYESRTSPVVSRTAAPCPSSSRRWHISLVRRSCQTMARWSGSPLSRSKPTVVSR